MSARSVLARALAPVTGAGAATNESSTPAIGITIGLGSGPIVTVGGAPAPRTGVTATVPVDGHVAATVGTPTVPGAAAPVTRAAAPVLAPAAPVLALGSAGRLVDADVRLHACIAAALLGGRA